MYYGLAVVSPYVGMAQKQDGGSNQCINKHFHGDIIAREQILVSKTTEKLIEPVPVCSRVTILKWQT